VLSTDQMQQLDKYADSEAINDNRLKELYDKICGISENWVLKSNGMY
jgi:hypothetical protein